MYHPQQPSPCHATRPRGWLLSASCVPQRASVQEVCHEVICLLPFRNWREVYRRRSLVAVEGFGGVGAVSQDRISQLIALASGRASLSDNGSGGTGADEMYRVAIGGADAQEGVSPGLSAGDRLGIRTRAYGAPAVAEPGGKDSQKQKGQAANEFCD